MNELEQQKTPQEIARRRNRLKDRIINIPVLQRDILTEQEIKMLSMIHILRNRLIDRWDENSIELGVKVKPKKDKFNETR